MRALVQSDFEEVTLTPFPHPPHKLLFFFLHLTPRLHPPSLVGKRNPVYYRQAFFFSFLRSPLGQ